MHPVRSLHPYLVVLFAACGFHSGAGVFTDAGELAPVTPSTIDAADPTPQPQPDGSVGTLDAAQDAAHDAPPTGDATIECGQLGEACCPTEIACMTGSECTSGVCTRCGAALESCCDPGATCAGLGVCFDGTCSL